MFKTLMVVNLLLQVLQNARINASIRHKFQALGQNFPTYLEVDLEEPKDPAILGMNPYTLSTILLIS